MSGEVAVSFVDLPSAGELEPALSRWAKPPLPDKLAGLVPAFAESRILEIAYLFRQGLAHYRSDHHRAQLEIAFLNWLAGLIRLNVKRGRVFDLRQVLVQREADCLGYAKLLTLLGRVASLDIGVVEVLTDNAGRHVPHTAVLARLADGQRRFVDVWYGSTDIHHRRYGLRVKQGDVWSVRDVEAAEFGYFADISYLPDAGVDAVTLYVYANRFLQAGKFREAVEGYTRAIRLYPENARHYFNRAVAYENLGQGELARTDYTRALRDEASQLRVRATQPPEIVALVDLDAQGVSPLAQGLYLLRYGFVTGKKVSLARVARRFHLSHDEAQAILSGTELVLALGTSGSR